MKIKTQIAIEKAGSSTALAGLLGISKGAITQWGEDLPEDRAAQLIELRPHWFPKSAALLAEALRQKIGRLEAPAVQVPAVGRGD